MCEHIHLSLKSINVIQIEVSKSHLTSPFVVVVFNMLEKQKKNHQKENTHRKPSHNHQKQIQWLEELQQHWHQWTHKITHSFVKIPPKKCVCLFWLTTLSLVCFVGVVCEENEKSSFFFEWFWVVFFEFFFWWSQTTSFKRSKSSFVILNVVCLEWNFKSLDDCDWITLWQLQLGGILVEILVLFLTAPSDPSPSEWNFFWEEKPIVWDLHQGNLLHQGTPCASTQHQSFVHHLRTMDQLGKKCEEKLKGKKTNKQTNSPVGGGGATKAGDVAVKNFKKRENIFWVD